MQRRFCALVLTPRTGAWIIPWSIARFYAGFINSSASVRLDIRDESAICEGCIGIQETFFESINDDTRSRGGYPDILIDEAIAVQGHKNLSGNWDFGLPRFILNCNFSEEVNAGVCQTDQQQETGSSDRRVDAIFDIGEDGDQDGCCPNQELEG